MSSARDTQVSNSWCKAPWQFNTGFTLYIKSTIIDYINKNIICKGGENMEGYEMPTDIQYKHELRKRLSEINRRLKMLENNDTETVINELKQEASDIQASLQDWQLNK